MSLMVFNVSVFEKIQYFLNPVKEGNKYVRNDASNLPNFMALF
jgi:hypothetical protein